MIGKIASTRFSTVNFLVCPEIHKVTSIITAFQRPQNILGFLFYLLKLQLLDNTELAHSTNYVPVNVLFGSKTLGS